MPFIFEINYPDGGKSEWILLFLGRYYQFADGSTQMIDEKAAWCQPCRQVIAAELLRPLPELERELAELQTGNGQLYDALRKLDIPVQQEMAELEKKLGWRRRRASSARCLECGSEALVPLPSEGEAVHPGNGRRITIRCQDRCQSVHLDARYSTEGVRIADQGPVADRPGDRRRIES